MMNNERIGNLTLEQLRSLIREEIRHIQQEEVVAAQPVQDDLSDFPVDNLGPWPEHLSLRREDIYGDDGR